MSVYHCIPYKHRVYDTTTGRFSFVNYNTKNTKKYFCKDHLYFSLENMKRFE